MIARNLFSILYERAPSPTFYIRCNVQNDRLQINETANRREKKSLTRRQKAPGVAWKATDSNAKLKAN